MDDGFVMKSTGRIFLKTSWTVIEDGNHENFAIHGHQDGDTTISRSEQIRQTVSAISRLLD